MRFRINPSKEEEKKNNQEKTQGGIARFVASLFKDRYCYWLRVRDLNALFPSHFSPLFILHHLDYITSPSARILQNFCCFFFFFFSFWKLFNTKFICIVIVKNKGYQELKGG